MLRRTSGRRLLATLALVLASVLVGWSGSAPVPASAEDCWQRVEVSPGVFTYVNTCQSGPSDPGGGDTGGGPSDPTCELTGLADYCIGEAACWANVPSALDPATWPEETRPSPEAIYTYQSCSPDPDGSLSGWSWYEPREISVADLARQAFGMLRTPAFEVGVNPPRQAIVGIETWFWAATGEPGTVRGSSAMGVVAIAEPDRIEVDPGDGSGVLSCPWTTAESGDCSYTYARSSAGQPLGPTGLPAYAARMRLVYDVRFENNGVALTVPGVPGTLESPWQETAVPVAEVQAVVTL